MSEEEEIWRAVWALGINTASGFDGFKNRQIFKDCWQIIKRDIC